MLEDARIMAVIPSRDLGRARIFYEKMLGLRPQKVDEDEGGVAYSLNNTGMYVYMTEAASGEATKLTFVVSDLAKEMSDLRNHGVVFEDFDLPNLKTVNGFAAGAWGKGAWFKDLDGNFINIMEET